MTAAWLPPEQFLATLPQFVMGTAVLVFDADDRLLMLHESYEPAREEAKDARRWLPPGGILDVGESVEQGARREMFEETGLKANRLTLVGTASYAPTPVWPAVTDHWFALPAPLTRAQAAKIELSHEHDQFRFSTPHDMRGVISPDTERLLDRFIGAFRDGRTVAVA